MPTISVKKPFTVLVGIILVLVLGVVAFTKMTTDLLPNMDLPYMVVYATDPGASPESVRRRGRETVGIPGARQHDGTQKYHIDIQ